MGLRNLNQRFSIRLLPCGPQDDSKYLKYYKQALTYTLRESEAFSGHVSKGPCVKRQLFYSIVFFVLSWYLHQVFFLFIMSQKSGKRMKFSWIIPDWLSAWQSVQVKQVWLVCWWLCWIQSARQVGCLSKVTPRGCVCYLKGFVTWW